MKTIQNYLRSTAKLAYYRLLSAVFIKSTDKLDIIIYQVFKYVKNTYRFHVIHNSWGDEIYIFMKRGEASVRLYYYYDERSTITITDLNVCIHKRWQGVGTELKVICEEIGKLLGANIVLLWAIEDSWMRNWYEKDGYKYYASHNKSDNTIWMRKELFEEKRLADYEKKQKIYIGI